MHLCFSFSFMCMYETQHQVNFLVCVNLPGNKPDSDSDKLHKNTTHCVFIFQRTPTKKLHQKAPWIQRHPLQVPDQYISLFNTVNMFKIYI